MAICVGITKAGIRCKKQAQKGSEYCAIHTPNTAKKVTKASKITKTAKAGKINKAAKTKKVVTAPAEFPAIDDAIFNLLLAMDPLTLDSACRTNTQFFRLCSTEFFKQSYLAKWGTLAPHDPFKGEKFVRLKRLNYFQSNHYLIKLYTDKNVAIYFNESDTRVLGQNAVLITVDPENKVSVTFFGTDGGISHPMFTKQGRLTPRLKTDKKKKLFEKLHIDYLFSLTERQIAGHLRNAVKEATKDV